MSQYDDILNRVSSLWREALPAAPAPPEPESDVSSSSVSSTNPWLRWAADNLMTPGFFPVAPSSSPIAPYRSPIWAPFDPIRPSRDMFGTLSPGSFGASFSKSPAGPKEIALPGTASASPPPATSSGGSWDHLVPGGKGKVERGGTHGGHPAIDIFAPAGTPIYAPADGVSSPGTYSLGGNATTLRGADGRWYYFAHARDAMRGGAVKKGDIIGYVGNSGNAKGTNPHLHYAVASDPSYFNKYNGSGDIDPS